MAEEIKVQVFIRVGGAYLRHRPAHHELNCPKTGALYDLGAGDMEMVFDGDSDILWALGY